ncbi:MAG: 23S rRNA (pseudouridine(1915)-N(3))-methyltransferase RlmH [Acidobacteria bacterium]|nr:23S rRNA (pseudouridine(1915)-N(3))-methyltransferase RlmH [Acidobacteriota bacterium]
MKLHLVWIGKTKERHCGALIDEYLKRLTRYVNYEVSELKESSGSPDEARVIQMESAKLLAAVERDDFVILLDESGREFTSVEFATLIQEKQQQGIKRLAFVIGGFAGVSEEVKKRAQLKQSLSRMTLTHEFARVLLTEQLYRSYTLLAGVPYHKF